MTFAKARDANEKAIVSALKANGWTVSRLQPVGGDYGLPDLVIGKHGWTTLAEVKRPPGPRGGRADKRLTEKQEKWHAEWRGTPPLILDSASDDENLARCEDWLAEIRGGVHTLPCYCTRCAAFER